MVPHHALRPVGGAGGRKDAAFVGRAIFLTGLRQQARAAFGARREDIVVERRERHAGTGQSGRQRRAVEIAPPPDHEAEGRSGRGSIADARAQFRHETDTPSPRSARPQTSAPASQDTRPTESRPGCRAARRALSSSPRFVRPARAAAQTRSTGVDRWSGSQACRDGGWRSPRKPLPACGTVFPADRNLAQPSLQRFLCGNPRTRPHLPPTVKPLSAWIRPAPLHLAAAKARLTASAISA